MYFLIYIFGLKSQHPNVTQLSISAAGHGCDAMWLKNFIADPGIVPSIQEPMEVFCDNKLC